MRVKATGERGSWFAAINQERLPCVHTRWTKFDKATKTMRYDDEHRGFGQPHWPEFLEALREKRKVILTQGNEDPETGRIDRSKYVATFLIDDIEDTGTNLRFRFVKRLDECE